MTETPSTTKKLRTMDDLPVDGRRVMLRVDFNVQVNGEGRVDATEDYRIKAAIPTIEELQQKRCKILLLTHLGEPKDNPKDADLTPVRHRLEELMGEEVKHVDKLYGERVAAVVSGMSPSEILLLPNVRTDDREKMGSEKFAELISQNADVYINEAFSVCHRPHTSMTLLPRVLPGAAGRRTVLEVETLDKLLKQPARPYVAIASGAKIETKIGMLYNLLGRVDKLCLGGQIANVFLAAQGRYHGAIFSDNDIAVAQTLLKEYAHKLVLPIDAVVGQKDGSEARVVSDLGELSESSPKIFDIGPATTEIILQHCREAATVMWNGPVGMFEEKAYNQGTEAIARGLAALSNFRVTGGGDTIITLEKLRLTSKFNHVSVGGGAMIAFLEDKRMPGLEPLYE